MTSRPRGEPRTTHLVVGSLGPGDAAALSVRGSVAVQRARAEVLICDLTKVARADLRAVDALARLQLVIKRMGGTVVLTGATEELLDLLAFVGLSEVFGSEPASGLEAERQPELREESGRVEEEVQPADPPA